MPCVKKKKKIMLPLITKMLNDDYNWFFLYTRVCA